MISLEEAKAAQAEMHAQGQRLLKAVPLEALFSTYGRYVIGGSFKHGLMVLSKPDIDGYIVTEKTSFDDGIKLLGGLFKLQEVRRVAIEREPDGSAELKVKVPFEGRLWNLDVHFCESGNLSSYDYLGHVRYTPEQANLMLLIKAQLAEQGLYPGSTKLPGSLSSVDVYEAVIEHGVETTDEAIAWAKGHETHADRFRAEH